MATTQNRYSYVIDGDADSLVRASTVGQAAVGKLDGAVSRLSFGLEAVTRFAGPLGAAFSVGAIAAFTKQTIDAIDALNDVSDATGSSIELISALDGVARRTGTAFETVEMSLVKFNQVLNQVDGKNGVSQALKGIGLDASELRKIDPAEALRQTAVALSGFADDGNKARLTQLLFSKSVKEVAPFLKDLSEQTALTGTITKEAAAQAEAFNKNMFALQANATDVGRSIVNTMVPAINEVIDRFKEGSKEGKSFFSIGWDRYQEVLRRDLPSMFTPIPPKAGNSIAGAGRGFINPELVRPSAPVISGAAGSAPRDTTESFNRALDAIDQEWKKRLEEHWYRSQEALDKIDETFAAGPMIAPELLKSREADERELFDFVASYKAANKDLNIALITDDKQRAMAQIALERETAQAKLDLLKKSGEDISAAQAELDENINLKRLSTEEAFEKKRVETMKDALQGTLLNVMRGDFAGILDYWTTLMQQMAAEALAAQLTSALFGSGGGGGFWDSVINGITSALGGGMSGGAATGSNYIERDMVTMLHKGEAVIPRAFNPYAPGGGGIGRAITINNTYNVGQGVQRAEMERVGRMAKDAAVAEVRNQVIRGDRVWDR